PVVQPARAPREGQPAGVQAGRPEAPTPGMPNVARPANGDIPNAPRFANGGTPQASGNPIPHQAFATGNGVPHPPEANNARSGIGQARAADAPSSPTWMQPHTPMERQRPAPPTALHAAGQNALPPVRSAAVPHPDGVPAPQGIQPGGRNEAPRALPQPQPDHTAQIPQPQPERAAPAPQPRPDFAQPAPPREVAPPRVNEYRPPAPAVHDVPRPQPQAPRMEPRPQ
ncbi:hypothetical protein M3654_22970, partial [Bacillus licheniformis]|nr:hypothetical protein [Bacillus licheniformis]